VEEIARQGDNAFEAAASGDAAGGSRPTGLPINRREDDEEEEEEEDDEDDEECDDETIFERIQGLSEMFPESLRTGSGAMASGSVGAVQWLYSMSRNISWVVFRYVQQLDLCIITSRYLLLFIRKKRIHFSGMGGRVYEKYMH
jgi:hypothetical protein